MKKITLSTLLLIFSGLLGGSPAQNTNSEWQLLTQGKFISAYAEKAAYRNESSDHFFIRVRLQNRTPETIGVDLNDFFKVFYPNQWGVYQKPQREAIDESRITPAKLDEQSTQKLLAGYSTKALTMIGPRASVDYFREFNASTIKDVEVSNGHFLIVSIDGRIDATNGKTAEALTLEWQNDAKIGATDVVIPYPIQWKRIPDDGLVIKTQIQPWFPVFPQAAVGSSPSRKPYRHAYYLYQERPEGCASCYIPLLITMAPLEDAKDQDISDCIPIVTYERDSIWQTLAHVTVRASDVEIATKKIRLSMYSGFDIPGPLGLPPGDNNTKLPDSDRNIVYKNISFRYQEVIPAEVVKLLEHPEGTIPLSRPLLFQAALDRKSIIADFKAIK